MNIHVELLKEKTHTRAHAMEITKYACSSKKNFRELMQCFLANEYRLAQRAAWSVSWAARQNPELIHPFIKDLAEQLQRTDVHDAVIRNSLRVLENIEIPKALHGKIMDACFKFIENPSAPAAFKAFSLTTLSNLSVFYPDITSELKLIIRDRWDHETAAFKSRGKKILQQQVK